MLHPFIYNAHKNCEDTIIFFTNGQINLIKKWNNRLIKDKKIKDFILFDYEMIPKTFCILYLCITFEDIFQIWEKLYLSL